MPGAFYNANHVLGSLTEAIRAGTTLAWYLEHGRAGDPVPAAWREATSPTVLVGLIATRTRRMVRPEVWTPVHAGHVAGGCPGCLAQIRAAVPELTFAMCVTPDALDPFCLP